MASKTRFAVWYRVGKVFVVRPPGWPKNCELSFTDKDDMLEWSRGVGVMLRDGNAGRKYA